MGEKETETRKRFVFTDSVFASILLRILLVYHWLALLLSVLVMMLLLLLVLLFVLT